jgi:poly(beta-D-mannuronate) C5 epimerase
MKNNVIFFIFLFFLTLSLSANKIDEYKQFNLEEYTVEKVLKKVKKKLYGNDVDLISVQRISVLPKNCIYKFKDIWSKKGILWPNIIVLSHGVYDLKMIHSILNNESILQKIGEDSYLLKRPIYISPTATLVVRDSTLKLSLEYGSFIIYHGNLDIIDSLITSWDVKKSNYGPREHLDKNEILMFLKHKARPFILGLAGSHTNMLNSDFIGLGFQGTPGMYGISITKAEVVPKNEGTLNALLKKRSKPSGMIIGNNISKCFFGFYCKNVKDLFLIGNLYSDNVIYNIDPHDYSKNLIVFRNITYGAQYKHGIIFSREVGNSLIAENITFGNKGSGIMLDRNCENTLIYKNISFENHTDGISILESDKNRVFENRVLRNYHNGIFIRNSLGIDVRYNYIYRNALNGIEAKTANIDKLETRDFKLDPYHQKTNVSIVRNYFENNINSALSIKDRMELFFYKNILHNSGPLYFSGDIETRTNDILKANSKNGFSYQRVKAKNP